MKRKDTIVIE